MKDKRIAANRKNQTMMSPLSYSTRVTRIWVRQIMIKKILTSAIISVWHVSLTIRTRMSLNFQKFLEKFKTKTKNKDTRLSLTLILVNTLRLQAFPILNSRTKWNKWCKIKGLDKLILLNNWLRESSNKILKSLQQPFLIQNLRKLVFIRRIVQPIFSLLKNKIRQPSLMEFQN